MKNLLNLCPFKLLIMRAYILFLVFIITTGFVYSGVNGDSEKQIYKDGVIAFEAGDYKTAGNKFIELISIDKTNAEYHFLAGLAIYKSETDLSSAIQHMENSKAYFKGDTIAEVYFYMGKIYHQNEQPELALKSFKTFQRHINSSKQGEILALQVKIEMEWIENSMKQNDVSETVSASVIEVKNLGKTINSEYGDYAPVKVSDERIAFTSRRPNANTESAYDGKPYEDIYFGIKNENWMIEEKIDKKIIYPAYNTLHHDAFISMDEESKTIYIYRYNKIHSAVYSEGRWSQLTEVEKINRNSQHTPSVALTPDGKTMYFAHEQKDGPGGKDIYVTKLNADGSWSKPENMGEKINTNLNEDAPFITPDGKTLYFSSEGRGSIGGFDFFKINIEDPAAQAEHLSCPFNTVANDIFIICDNSGTKGIFSSSRKGGIGGMDLYEFKVTPKVDSNLIVSSHTDLVDSAEATEIISYSKDALFQKNFGYNQNTIEKNDAGFSDWMTGVEKLAASKQKLIVHIESSASKVPTTTYVNNKKLAAVRAQNAKEALEKILIEKGFDMNNVKITVSSEVNGPAYKGDFEGGKSVYEQFQYIKVTVKSEKGL